MGKKCKAKKTTTYVDLDDININHHSLKYRCAGDMVGQLQNPDDGGPTSGGRVVGSSASASISVTGEMPSPFTYKMENNVHKQQEPSTSLVKATMAMMTRTTTKQAPWYIKYPIFPFARFIRTVCMRRIR